MIESAKGNLLKADAEALVNAVNCVGKSKIEDVSAGLEALIIDVQKLEIHSIAIPLWTCQQSPMTTNGINQNIVQMRPKIQVLENESGERSLEEYVKVDVLSACI